MRHAAARPSIRSPRFAPRAIPVLILGLSCLAASGGDAVAGAAAVDDDVPFFVAEDVAADESARKIAAMQRMARGERPPTANQLDWDAQYYSLDLDLDDGLMQLTGTVVAEGTVVATSITQVELDLESDLTVSEVRVAGGVTTFSHSQNLLTVDLDHAYATGERFSIAVDYSGNPAGDSFGWDSHAGNPMIWTLSEPYGAREWWPCKDWPTDKADEGVDLYATVDQSLVVASNGTLESVTPVGSGLLRYHWHEAHPITTYLVSMAIHPYSQYSLYYHYAPTDSMEIQYFVYPDHMGSVQETYAMVPNMIAHYADMYGEYPFLDEKYGHAEFEWGGGMEHQTCTSLGGWGEMLIAHELAHMWWGDYVTCDSFHHIWLNEGFATYSEALYLEREYGPQAMHDDMANNAYYGEGTIYVEDPQNFGEIFNSDLSYRKASWVLHMLRHVVGDATFFQILQTYYTQYGHSTATTEQFQAVCEQVSGMSLQAFFQQWIYGDYFPVYSYGWTASEQGDAWEITLDIEQIQTNQLFWMPIDVEIELAGGGTETQVVVNEQAAQQYLLTVAEEPLAVRLDPENWILKQVLVPVVNPTFDQGILLVNGVDWDTYSSEIRAAYEERAFWGDHSIAFWDLFDTPTGGYPSTLPAPLGHGAVDPAVMGQYSTVIWIGNNYSGDLNLWFQSPNLSYLQAGGNLLFMSRMAQDFFIDQLRDYLGVEWTAASRQLYTATAQYPGLETMSRYGTNSYNATFDIGALGPETTLLFTEDSYTPDAGIGAWRTNPGDGGELVFLSGRPYRWNRTLLRGNCELILTELLGEGSGTGIAGGEPAPVARMRLGRCVPNPMNPSTRIPFELAGPGVVTLRIYDVAGRMVRELLTGELEAGTGSVTWDGRNAGGREVGSGTYYIRLATPDGEATRSVTLVR